MVTDPVLGSGGEARPWRMRREVRIEWRSGRRECGENIEQWAKFVHGRPFALLSVVFASLDSLFTVKFTFHREDHVTWLANETH